MSTTITWAETGRLPDPLIRFGIRRLVKSRLRDERDGGDIAVRARKSRRLAELRSSPIAQEVDAANAQHYEVPAAFYESVLGKHLKYSACWWGGSVASLDAAEAAMLEMYAERAELVDGQTVLDLGCGWGSLTLWLAARHPRSRITAVSNSASQRAFIEARARERGLRNVRVLTADVNTLDLAPRTFDRVVSVEMFEHVRNYEQLLRRISTWLKADGRLFVHIFCHRDLLYPFEAHGDDDWMGRHFFTGGLMPSIDTLVEFQRDVALLERWSVPGTHYAKTARAWLDNLDANRARARAALLGTVGEAEVDRALQRWRMFFMACEELFGYRDGSEWLVAHYLFAPTR
jgi:cyclopropane-fatty-acyl-phospholipid synthase